MGGGRYPAINPLGSASGSYPPATPKHVVRPRRYEEPSGSRIQDVLSEAKGQRVLFVDTCYSQQAYNPRLVKDAYDAGIAVFTATDDAYVAQEIPKLKHGVMTYALLEGLKGKADSLRRPDRMITLSELQQYVEEEVPHLTQQQQRPQVFLGAQSRRYVIARMAAATQPRNRN